MYDIETTDILAIIIIGHMCFYQSWGTGQNNDYYVFFGICKQPILKLHEEYLLRVSIKSCNLIVKYEHKLLQLQKCWQPWFTETPPSFRNVITLLCGNKMILEPIFGYTDIKQFLVQGTSFFSQKPPLHLIKWNLIKMLKLLTSSKFIWNFRHVRMD